MDLEGSVPTTGPPTSALALREDGKMIRGPTSAMNSHSEYSVVPVQLFSAIWGFSCKEEGAIFGNFLSLALCLITASSLVNLKIVCTPVLIDDALQPCHICSVQVLNACVPEDSPRSKFQAHFIVFCSPPLPGHGKNLTGYLFLT